jgi:hypothetical protein
MSNRAAGVRREHGAAVVARVPVPAWVIFISPIHSFAAIVLIQVKVNFRPEAAYVSRQGAGPDAVSCSKVFPAHLETTAPSR